jgi:hypothetical protein
MKHATPRMSKLNILKKVPNIYYLQKRKALKDLESKKKHP